MHFACWFDMELPLPLLVSDEERSWEMECESCSVCYGHYMDPKEAMSKSCDASPPPSSVLHDTFSQKGILPETQLETVSHKVLLPPSGVSIWFDHLSAVKKNCKRGAAKAAETRRKKAEQAQKERMPNSVPENMIPIEDAIEYKCGICEGLYEDETLEKNYG